MFVPNLKLCTFCEAIRYEDLPAEDEDGVPHQPTFLALEESAETCALCKLLFEGCCETRGKIREQYCGGDNFPIGFISYEALGEKGPDKPMLITHHGHYRGNIFSQPRVGNKGLGMKDSEFEFQSMTSVRPYLYGNWWKLTEKNTPLQLIGLGVRLGTSPSLKDAEGNEPLKWVCRGSQLRVRTIGDDSVSSFITGRLRTAHANSPLALKQIKAWLSECNSKHEGIGWGCCPRYTYLPTRVIEVSPTLKLVNGLYRNEKYIALSHCWGSSHSYITTSKNLAARQQDIPFEELPQTFKDAVTMTRELGVRYIWIDSLCILQDVPEDWQREAPRMADVYTKSYLTLSASSSTGDSAGLYPVHVRKRWVPAQTCDQFSLGRRTVGNDSPILEDSPNKPSGWDIIAQRPFAWNNNYEYKGTKNHVFLSAEWMPSSRKAKPETYLIGYFGRPHDPIAKDHLSTRAWTLQERVLSPRILHFSTDQMFWECKYLGIAEDGTRTNYTKYDTNAVLRGQSLPLSECGADDMGLSLIEGYKPITTEGHARWNGSWLALVEQFTARNISFEKDRLSAMSGLAQLIVQFTDDKYFAGIWKNFMVEDLCWRTYPQEESRGQVPDGFEQRYVGAIQKITPAEEYRAPSWSWASLNGRIKFLPIDPKRLCMSIIECYTEPATKDPYGSVVDSVLTVKAPFFPVTKAADQTAFDKRLPLGFGVLSEIELQDGISQGEVYFDIEPAYPCYAIFIDSSNCLILCSTEHDSGPRGFERIGAGKFFRTPEQRKLNPLQNVGTLTPYGPITGQNVENNLETVTIY